MHVMYFTEQLLFLEVGCGAPITVMGRPADGATRPIEVDTWDRELGVHAKGAFLGARTAIPVMRKGGGAAICEGEYPYQLRPPRLRRHTTDRAALQRSRDAPGPA